MSAARQAVEIETLKARTIELATANQSLRASLSSTTAASARYAEAVARSRNELLNARMATSQLVQQQNSSAISSNQLKLAILQQVQAVIQARGAVMQLAAQNGSAAFQAAKLKATTASLIASIHQDRAATQLAAQAKLELQGAMKRGVITASEYRNAVNQLTAAHRGLSAGAGRMQMAINQAIFAVDDAVTVYGTMGLAGAVRAASNNLTMMAGLLGGPWGLAIGVAIAAATQLYFTLNKAAEATKDAEKAESAYQKTLSKRNNIIRSLMSLNQSIDTMDSEEDVDREIKGREGELETIQKQQEYGERVRDQLQEKLERMKQKAAEIAPNTGIWDLWGAKTNAYNIFMKEIAKTQGQLNAQQKDLANLADERYAKEQELNLLLAKRPEILRREAMAMSDTLNREISAELPFDGNRQVDEILRTRQSRQDQFEKMREAGLRTDDLEEMADRAQAESLRKVFDPVAKSIIDEFAQMDNEMGPKGRESEFAIAQRFAAREKMFRENITDPEEMESAIARAREAALKEMGRGDKDLTNPGPSGMEAGSKEAFDVIRNAILQQNKPKDDRKAHEQKLEKYLSDIASAANRQKELTNQLIQRAATGMNLPGG